MTVIRPDARAASSMTADHDRAAASKSVEAAQQFEAIFVSMVLKEARKASFGDALFASDALNSFRDMQDGFVAREIGRRGSLGLGKAVAAFLEKADAASAPAARPVFLEKADAASMPTTRPAITRMGAER